MLIFFSNWRMLIYVGLIMAAFVFAMGLSLLGVFELPVPGMIGSAAGGQQKEGLPGAFLTGVLLPLFLAR